MKTIFSFFLLILPLVGNAAEQKEDGLNWVVLPKSGLHGEWTPEGSDAFPLFALAKQHLENLKQRGSPLEKYKAEFILSRWTELRCQIVGYTVSEKKLIHLNVFRVRGAREWRSRYLKVFDGGPANWRIDYDPQEKRFVNFETNGTL